MKLKVKTAIVTFYDMVTKTVFKKEFFGRFTQKEALRKLNPENKTKVIDITNTTTVYEIDNNSLIEFIANNGKRVNNGGSAENPND